MFTLNGLKKVDCSLQGNCIKIGDNHYGISSMRNITSFKLSIYLVFVMLLVMAVVTGSFFLYEYFGGGDKIGALFLLGAFIITSIGTGFLIWLAVIQNKCRSMYRINFNHMLYVEKSDDSGIENALAALPVPDETNLTKPSNKVITKSNKVILAILCLAVLAGFLYNTSLGVVLMLLLYGYVFYLREAYGVRSIWGQA